LVITKILNYKIHEKTPTDNFEQATNIINWGNEPILKSEHDDRKRVYLLSETLADTDSVKGELIIYPKNTSCPEHYHVGAEHYQFLTEGNVVAVLDGKEYELSKYDVLYNFENENHWFYTKNSNCEFVEFFIPGEAKTIWTQTTNVCTWSPIGTDINGKKPSREIEKHVHGEGKNI
jgi:quercetin dioxygenase-like cupin family protein